MTDIVIRLRNWRTVHLARLHLLMDEAADEIAILRSDNNRRANLEAGLRDAIVRLSANVDCPGQDNAAKQDILTDAERAAIDRARLVFRDMDHNVMTMQQLEDYEALCSLLERL
jgi:hypothetical protein